MSNIQKFKEEYSSDNDLEKELLKIEKMDSSNIKKIDLRQKVIEKYRIEAEWFKIENWYCDEALVDELMLGYGIGSVLSDNDDFDRANELGRWG